MTGFLNHRAEARFPKPAKRTPKPRKPIARNVRPRKVRKTTVGMLKRKLWTAFAGYVKDRDGPVCFTCGAPGLAGGNWHAGHCIRQSGHAAVEFDPKNVHSQCRACNIWRSGNVTEYVTRLIERYGFEEWTRLMKRARQTKSWTMPELRGLIDALKSGPVVYECYYYERYL